MAAAAGKCVQMVGRLFPKDCLIMCQYSLVRAKMGGYAQPSCIVAIEAKGPLPVVATSFISGRLEWKQKVERISLIYNKPRNFNNMRLIGKNIFIS